MTKIKFFKITLTEKWVPSQLGFFDAKNHREAMAQVDTVAKRIYNARFREIEMTGKYYSVQDMSPAGKTFVFEVE